MFSRIASKVKEAVEKEVAEMENERRQARGTSPPALPDPKTVPLPWDNVPDVTDEGLLAMMKEKILALSHDKHTFLDAAALRAPNDVNSLVALAQRMVVADPYLDKMRFWLVPRKVSEEAFWTNYFARVVAVREAMRNTERRIATGEPVQLPVASLLPPAPVLAPEPSVVVPPADTTVAVATPVATVAPTPSAPRSSLLSMFEDPHFPLPVPPYVRRGTQPQGEAQTVAAPSQPEAAHTETAAGSVFAPQAAMAPVPAVKDALATAQARASAVATNVARDVTRVAKDVEGGAKRVAAEVMGFVNRLAEDGADPTRLVLLRHPVEDVPAATQRAPSPQVTAATSTPAAPPASAPAPGPAAPSASGISSVAPPAPGPLAASTATSASVRADDDLERELDEELGRDDPVSKFERTQLVAKDEGDDEELMATIRQELGDTSRPALPTTGTASPAATSAAPAGVTSPAVAASGASAPAPVSPAPAPTADVAAPSPATQARPVAVA